MSAEELLQAAFRAALEAHAPLAGQVTAIFDAPPVRGLRPYALVEQAVLTDWGTKDMAGREARIAVTLFDTGERPARLGPARGFRLRDPFDFAANDEAIGTGNGAEAMFPLVKHYGGVARRITRPVGGSVRVALDGVETEAFTLGAGGMVALDAPPYEGVAVTASFVFDVPVRFAEDRLNVSRATFLAGAAASVPLVEIRE